MNYKDHNIIVFDDECALCSSLVRFIIQRDRSAALKFAAFQSETGQKICKQGGFDPADMQTFIFFKNGELLTQSTAALEVITFFNGAWKILRILKFVPRPLRDWVYAFVARNRSRWFGRLDECMIPNDEIRDRFL
jgi:predicted DCC family thiol-disulfide oxidoreductase YuxK